MQLGDKTRPGVLPQLRAPETAEADKLWVGTKRFAVVMPGCNIGEGNNASREAICNGLETSVSRKDFP